MIWGMTLEPGKLYTEIMGEEVQLSLAAIDSRKDAGESPNNSFCQIVMKTSKGEYVLCTLVHGVMFQQNLDLKIMPREKVTFSVQGPSVVYLVGYTASYPEDEEEFGDIREEELDESEGSSAWEAFESEDSSQQDHIKQEPIEILDDQPTQEGELPAQQEGESPSQQEGEAPSQHQQPEQPLEGGNQGEQEEIIFSIPDLDTDVKTEPPDVKPPDAAMPAQMTALEGMYGMQATDNGTVLPQTSTDSDYFYPETQQPPDVPPTPVPAEYQPPDSAPGYHPQANPQEVLPPPSEQFLPPQRPMMQTSQAGPLRHPVGRGTVQAVNTQRNYPPQRRQYGTNRSQPTGKSRSVPQPMNVQQMRNVRNMHHPPQQQQQSMPGPSQQDVPGPSTSGSTHLQRASNISLRTGSRAYKCRYCRLVLPSAATLDAHRNVHGQRGDRYRCQFCEKTYTLPNNRDRHEHSHWEKKFVN